MGGTTAFLDLTYSNNPISIGVGGTEYSVGQNGTVFLRLLDGNSNPINLATCNATAYYPNKTQWFRQQMTQLGSGYYYYDIAVPSITGVYITGFDCLFPSTPWNSNQSLSGVVLDATVNDYEASIFFDDTNNVTINSAYLNVSVSNSIAGANLGVNFNGVKLGSLTGVSGIMQGNYTLNASNFVLGEAQVYTLTHDGTGTNSPNWIRLFVNYTYNSQPSIIRGQTELHVSTPSLTNATDVASNVWNFTPVRNLTDYNQSAMNTALGQIQGNQSSIISLLNSIRADTQNIIGNVSSWVWTYAVRTLTDFTGVWNVTSRNLTYYPYPNVSFNGTVNATLNLTVNTTVVNVTNVTLNVTNATVVNQTLNITVNNTNTTFIYNYTYPLNLTVLNQTVNVTTEVVNVTNYTVNVTTQNVTVQNITLNTSEVWSYPNRTLTDYNQTGVLGALTDIKNMLGSLFNYTAMSEFVWNYTARYTHGVLTG